MATFNLTTTDLTTLNRVRVNIFERSSDISLIPFASQTQAAPHPETTWTFDKLIPSKSYQYQWIEIDVNDLTIQTYAIQNFTVPSAGSIQIKPPQDIQVGLTQSLVAGNSSISFTDWIGWEITVEEVGTGTMKRGEAYSYDITTGTFTLLGQDHIFIYDQRFFIRFEPKVTPVSPIVSPNLWSDIKIVNNDIVLSADDIGKKIIIIGTGTYLKITLPDISTVIPGRLIFFETTKGNHINVIITSFNPNAIDWLEGNRTNLYLGKSENISIYNYNNNWRIHSYEGNFKTVGRFFSSYNEVEDNAVEANGIALSVNEYSRLYNDFVLKQNPERLVGFSDWQFGNNGYNKFKFSFANLEGFFHTPDLRGEFQINSGGLGMNSIILNSGDFLPQQMIDIRHFIVADDISVIDKKPDRDNNIINWGSNRLNNNQDYDLIPSATNKIPTLGMTSGPIDQYGNSIITGDKIRPNSYANRLFINT